MKEESSTVALVPSTKHIAIAASQRHSFPNRMNDYSLTLNDVITVNEPPTVPNSPNRTNEHKPRFTWEALSAIISILYCYLLVVLGLALPVTQMITKAVPAELYDMFYIYLYGGSLTFILSINIIGFKKKAAKKLAKSFAGRQYVSNENETKYENLNSHGSFYLRLGASAFGIGSMVYSGLEFGEHFLEDGGRCDSTILSATKPALRMVFTLLQIQFIFLSKKSLHKGRCQNLMRISLAHMLATNLAEWLAVIIEETKHEIHNLHPHHQDSGNHTNGTDCNESNSGILIQGATAYLFPCAIEYSLICAVTLVEMWKEIRIDKKAEKFVKPLKELPLRKESHMQYSVDCTHSEKGLSAGLVATVYTLISLIVFFSLRTTQKEAAYLCLTYCEVVLYISSIIAMVTASYEMKNLAYCIHRLDSKGSLKLGLDISLLLKAQIGTYMYYLFSFIACLFTPGASVWPDLFAIFQSSLQTIFILDTWWKRCATPKDQEKKPGRQCLTFLRLMNMAMWIITITEKSRAELKPLQLAFYGMWPWTIITHISMPLNVFYRFHSSICLFEVWRNSYKGIHGVPDSDLMF